jgi:aminopeptidase N
MFRQTRRLGALAVFLLGCAHACMAQILPAYGIAVRVFPEDRRMEVSGTMRIPASKLARQDVSFWFTDRASDLRMEAVEPSAGVTLEKTREAPKEQLPGVSRNAKWRVNLSKAIPAGKIATFRFSYKATGDSSMLYYIGPEVAVVSGWGDSWYPTLVDGQDKGTCELSVTVPAGWIVATGGVRRGNAEEEARGLFRSAFVHPTYFSFSAGKFEVARRPGSTPIAAYTLSHRDHIDNWLAGVEKMLGVLSAEFGPYRFPELALIEVPRDIAQKAGFNAFSAPGMLVLNHRAFNAPDVKFMHEWLGHEMSHQWFPHVLTLRSPHEMLVEALAEYGGMRVVETLAGPEAATRMRMTGFEFDPIYSASAYFKLVAAGQDHPIAHLGQSMAHRDLAYNKGSFAFDMLSNEIGREKFQGVWHKIAREHKDRPMTWKEFTKAISDAAGRNMDWFFDQWFERPGAPDYQLSWKQEGDLTRLTINQPAPYYRAHLKVEIRGKEGQRLTRTVEIKGAKVELSVKPGFAVDTVVLDPAYEVLRWTPEFHKLQSKPTQMSNLIHRDRSERE